MASGQQKILQTAEELFWQNGYNGTSLNDLVRAAGLSKGAYFHYYPNKRAVITEILTKYAEEQIFETLDHAMKTSPSVAEGLKTWLRFFYETFERDDLKGGCMLGNFALELSDTDPKIRSVIEGLISEWERRIRLYLLPLTETDNDATPQEALTMGPSDIATLFIAGVQGLTLISKAHKDQKRSFQNFKALYDLIDKLIIPAGE